MKAKWMVRVGSAALLLAAACGAPGAGAGADAAVGGGPTDGAPTDADDVTLDTAPDGAAPAGLDLAGVDAPPALAVGGLARVTATELNLRSGPGTSNPILAMMPCGTTVQVVGGPSAGWWNVVYTPAGGAAETGWASGLYLVAASAFDPARCGGGDGGTSSDGAVAPTGVDVASIFARAKLGVGYSYYWGHGSWRSDGAQRGACTGTCPSCSHSGVYGADCSGFVAKCWQVPSPSPIDVDLHPYSTYNFYNQTTHWAPVPRSQLQPADALTYNMNGHGHIVLVESESAGDPWGNLWVYEARGCSYGIQHDLRAFSSTYIDIRREGL